MPPIESTEAIQCFFIKRKTDLTREQFQEYYRGVHGPLSVQMQKIMGFSYYEQWHTVGAADSADSPAGKSRAMRGIPHTAEFDGMSLLFYKDDAAWEAAWNVKNKNALQQEVDKKLFADNRAFVNMRVSPGFRLRPRYSAGVLKDVHPSMLPASVKRSVTVFPLTRPEGVTREQFQKRWRDGHGPIVESVLADIGAVKYMQLHVDKPSAPGKGMPFFDGIAVVWRDSDAAAGDDAKVSAARAKLLADEKEFIDLPKSYYQQITPMFTSSMPGADLFQPYSGPVKGGATPASAELRAGSVSPQITQANLFAAKL